MYHSLNQSNEEQMALDAEAVNNQLDKHRRTVAFDSYDLSVRSISDMVIENQIDVAPAYQRHFKWNSDRQSQLIESLFLGIPIPNLFMATNKDSTWEVVDGLQRLTTVINFIGSPEEILRINPRGEKLRLTGLEKLDSLNGFKFEDLPKSLQVMFKNRILRVTVLNDRSDYDVRFDLFERLNTGGVKLHPQEIRNCIFVGEFNEFVKECAKIDSFVNIVKLTSNAELSGSLDELVLRFFAYYENSSNFDHGVTSFLNDYMKEKATSFKNKKKLLEIFKKTMEALQANLPNGVVRGNRINTTPIVLFEAISVGVAKAIDSGKSLKLNQLKVVINDPALKKLTTGATNNRKALLERIELVQLAIQA